MLPESRRPLIFDIHRHALDDGPGIRTTVFFKGCPLACVWCHNPEGIHNGPELYYQDQNCIACGECVSACPHGALALNSVLEIRRQQCNGCGQCAAQCPSKALTVKGHYYARRELLAILLKDQRFYENSGGGVTFSGGEPTRHPDYLAAVARGLKNRGIHVALQTCGHFQWDLFETELLPWIDLIFFDLKHLDPQRHHELTGRTNQTILENFLKLIQVRPDRLVCSIPLINGLNTDWENLLATADTIGAIDHLPYRLHPYHSGVLVKATSLGKTADRSLSARAMSLEQYQQIAASFEALVNKRRKRR